MVNYKLKDVSVHAVQAYGWVEV